MIPGVLAQTLKRPPPPTHVNISLTTPHQASAARNLGLSKAIAVGIGQSTVINRSKALPKVIAAGSAQIVSAAPRFNKILSPRIGQAIVYVRSFGRGIFAGISQRVFSPQTQPGNLRATQVTLQVLEADNTPANLRATQVTLQVLRSET
jgi:hypothetical protein